MPTPIVLPDSNNLKRCSKCHEWKPFEAFYRDSDKKDGYHGRCIACVKENRVYNERSRERSRAWREAHPHYHKERSASDPEYRAKTQSYVKQWRAEHPERILEYSRRREPRKRDRYYKSDYWREYHRKRYAADPEYYRSRVRAYAAANPDKVRARQHLRRSTNNGSFTSADIEAIRVAQGNRCYLCHKKLKKYHIDHFIPLSKGGTNDPGNLRLACPKCNMSKHDKHPFELGILL